MSGCLPLSEVLHAEYNHLYPTEKLPDSIKGDLDAVVAALHQKKRAAVCISGGGIRSASFALGVIQGLAKLGTDAKDSVLAQIDYLSTVSGGGYIGSWLSGWAKRKGGMEEVIKELREPTGEKMKPEPAPVHHLREYSNYLTPQLGLLSADTWSFLGAYFRNLLLMWMVLVPFFLGILALPRLFVSLVVGEKQEVGLLIEYAAIALFVWALGFVGLTRPTAKTAEKKWLYSNGAFQILCLPPLCLFAVALVIGHAWFDLTKYGLWNMVWKAAAVTVFSSLIYTFRKVRDEVRPDQQVWKNQLIELVVAALSGALLGTLIYLFLRSFPFSSNLPHMQRPDVLAWVNGQIPSLTDSVAASYIVFGVPLVLLALLLQATVFVGGTGRFNDDFDREWWGRAGAWVIIASIGWIVITAVVIYGPVGIYYAPRTIGLIGGVSGLFAMAVGRSSKTGANDKQKQGESTTGGVSSILAALATPIFALVLLAALSLGTTLALRACLEQRKIIVPRPDQHLEVNFLKRTSWTFEGRVNKPQVAPPRVAALGPGEQKLKTIEHPAIEADKLDGLDHLYVVEQTPLATAAVLVLGSLLLALLASSLIGVNRFSMHALYRDRIIRAYLGASNDKRRPNPFTGFDPNDNILIKDLQSLQRPMHVVNMCLNLTSGDDLAWQERKAESFTASPLHCGSLNLGYRPSGEYGGPRGMKLGTAVGISGAAASPNMGYHSSPALALILTFFNVRLGWWLGNPKDDRAYKLDNPTSSLRPLLSEALGMSDNKQPYIYLSDGGHFENLGFYEMVLRRCRYVVVSDGGQDQTFTFEDLGNAIRKIYIDFGIRVVIDNVRLYPRSPDREKKFDNPKYCATGRILYSAIDGNSPEEDGEFVYIKPVFYGSEPRDIYNYASGHDTFPHEPTMTDQFFSESQLESYRGLGEHAVNEILKEKKPQNVKSASDFIEAAKKYAEAPLAPVSAAATSSSA
jgi:hypothetical protein